MHPWMCLEACQVPTTDNARHVAASSELGMRSAGAPIIGPKELVGAWWAFEGLGQLTLLPVAPLFVETVAQRTHIPKRNTGVSCWYVLCTCEAFDDSTQSSQRARSMVLFAGSSRSSCLVQDCSAEPRVRVYSLREDII